MASNVYEQHMKAHLDVLSELEEKLMETDAPMWNKLLGQMLVRGVRAICAAVERNTLEQMRNR